MDDDDYDEINEGATSLSNIKFKFTEINKGASGLVHLKNPKPQPKFSDIISPYVDKYIKVEGNARVNRDHQIEVWGDFTIKTDTYPGDIFLQFLHPYAGNKTNTFFTMKYHIINKPFRSFILSNIDKFGITTATLQYVILKTTDIVPRPLTEFHYNSNSIEDVVINVPISEKRLYIEINVNLGNTQGKTVLAVGAPLKNVHDKLSTGQVDLVVNQIGLAVRPKGVKVNGF